MGKERRDRREPIEKKISSFFAEEIQHDQVSLFPTVSLVSRIFTGIDGDDGNI